MRMPTYSYGMVDFDQETGAVFYPEEPPWMEYYSEIYTELEPAETFQDAIENIEWLIKRLESERDYMIRNLGGRYDG